MDNHEAPDALALRVARLLRHEVGDLLQGVYATTSILLSRFGPAQALEHRLVSDLQRRAELLRSEVDGVVHLLDEEADETGCVDVGGLFQAVLAGQRRAAPDLPTTYQGPAVCQARGAVALLPEALYLLVAALAQGASSISVSVSPGTVVECVVEAPGRTPLPDQLAWIDAPFQTIRQPLLGLALAMTARAIVRVGGMVHSIRLEQGVAVRLSLPTVPEHQS